MLDLAMPATSTKNSSRETSDPGDYHHLGSSSTIENRERIFCNRIWNIQTSKRASYKKSLTKSLKKNLGVIISTI